VPAQIGASTFQRNAPSIGVARFSAIPDSDTQKEGQAMNEQIMAEIKELFVPMGKPAHLKASSGKPGRTLLDDDERARRAYDYATRHDSQDIPALRERIEALEAENKAIKAALTDLTNKLGRRSGMITSVFGGE
jgi:hypothetical protein